MAGQSGSISRDADGILDFIGAAAAPMLKRHGVRRAWVFCSASRGDSGPGSDVDLLVEFDDDATLLTQAQLQIELQSALGRPVDVTTAGGLKAAIREQVMQELVEVV